MYNSTAPCSTADENAFGPQVRASCLHGFDFTLLFEESILTIAPLGIALLLLPFRVCALWKAPGKVYASWLYVLKVVGQAFYIHSSYSKQGDVLMECRDLRSPSRSLSCCRSFFWLYGAT